MSWLAAAFERQARPARSVPRVVPARAGGSGPVRRASGHEVRAAARVGKYAAAWGR